VLTYEITEELFQLFQKKSLILSKIENYCKKKTLLLKDGVRPLSFCLAAAQGSHHSERCVLVVTAVVIMRVVMVLLIKTSA